MANNWLFDPNAPTNPSKPASFGTAQQYILEQKVPFYHHHHRPAAVLSSNHPCNNSNTLAAAFPSSGAASPCSSIRRPPVVLSGAQSSLYQQQHRQYPFQQQQQQQPSSWELEETMMMLSYHHRAQQEASRLQSLAAVASSVSHALVEPERQRQPQLPQQQQQQQQQQPQQKLPQQKLPQQQQQQQTSNWVESPTDMDVLFGRGGRSNHHIGNERYRELIRNSRERYVGLAKHDKIKMSRTIVEIIQNLGGRFLEPDRDGGKCFVVVSTKRAVEKTSQCLREKRGMGTKQQQGVSA